MDACPAQKVVGAVSEFKYLDCQRPTDSLGSWLEHQELPSLDLRAECGTREI